MQKNNSPTDVQPEPALTAPEVTAVASQEWRAYIEPLLSIGERLVPQMDSPQDPQLRRELYRAIFSQLSSAYYGLLYTDPQHPDFWPILSPAYSYGAMNPDDDYYAAPIEESGVYKISGFRGTVKRVDLQVGTGSFIPRGVPDAEKIGVTLSNYDFDDLAIGKHGSFEVVLSAERPTGYNGNWWKLFPRATYIMLRQISYDWINEVDARLAIERLDLAAAKPRHSVEKLEEDLKQIAKWAESTVQFSLFFAQTIYRDQGINQLQYKEMKGYAEIIDQKYVYGGFDLATDEALIVEFQVPKKSRYWSIHLMDYLGFAMEWVNRHTILNGHTAIVDKDGICRVVISARDPGVANWLDTMGYQTGGIQVRWEQCSSWPEHKVTKLKAADVLDKLPAFTQKITPEARDAVMRLRRKGAQMRKRW